MDTIESHRFELDNITLGVNTVKRYRLLFCLPIIALLSTGCMVMGRIVGEDIESDEVYYKETKIDLQNFELSNISDEATLKILKSNGDTLMGNFMGNVKIPIEDYSEEFMDIFKDSIYFPSLGDTISVTSQDKSVEYHKFLGFEYGGMRLGEFNGDEFVISLEEPNVLVIDSNQILSQIAYEEISAKMSRNIKAVPFDKYLKLMKRYGLPTKSALLVQQSDGIVKIPLDDISQIIVIISYKKNYAIEGLLVGLGIDILIIALLIDNIDLLGGPRQLTW